MINSALGKVVDAVMIDENDHDYFVQPARNGQTYRLPKDESPRFCILAVPFAALSMKMKTTSCR